MTTARKTPPRRKGAQKRARTCLCTCGCGPILKQPIANNNRSGLCWYCKAMGGKVAPPRPRKGGKR